MTKTLKDLRPVYVVGAGWHRYQPLTDTTFVTLGLAAVRGALADAGIEYPSVESAFVATALLPMAPGRPILRHLGASGIELIHIENASASSSAAFRKACIEVASGLVDVALVLGVDRDSEIVAFELGRSPFTSTLPLVAPKPRRSSPSLISKPGTRTTMSAAESGL